MKHLYKNLVLIIFLICFFSLNSCVFAKTDMNPKDYNGIKKLGDFYCDKEDFSKAAFYYNKAVEINKNETDLNKLGLIYYLKNDYDNSEKCFEEALELNPSNMRTRNKIEVIKQIRTEKEKQDQINFSEPREKAPKKLHNLISVEGKLKNEKDEQKLHKIIDFIWSDPEGKILLKKLYKVQVQILLDKKAKYSSEEFGHIDFTNSQLAYGNNFQNMACLYVNQVRIKESDISNFQGKNTNLIQNMECIAVVSHELCHLCHKLYFPKTDDTKEEELVCTLIGFNIASRTLNDTPLDENTALNLAYYFCNNIFTARKYPYFDLKSFGNFVNDMSSIGIIAPYGYLCYDLKKIKFKENKNSPIIKNYLYKINYQFLKEYETVFSTKNISVSQVVYLNDDLNYLIFKTVMYKKDWNIFNEQVFNLKLALLSAPFPKGCKDKIIPLSIYRYKNKAIAKYRGK